MAAVANFGDAFNGTNSNSNSNYSEALPVANANLAGYKQYDDLLHLLKKLHHSVGRNMDGVVMQSQCAQANEQLRILNASLPAESRVDLLKCHKLTKESVKRRYKHVKALSKAVTAGVLGWGPRGGARRTRRGGRRRGRQTRRRR